ncbi:LOW QUALITY PROTEIN: hypothetical protein HID58_090756, partial [Brassica napus]
GAPIEWVSNHRYHHKHCDTQRDPHSPTQGFCHMTWIFDTGSIFNQVSSPNLHLHLMAYALLLYLCGGMPFLVWGIRFLTLGEGWHNNHHAFQFSAAWTRVVVAARRYLYLIRFLEAIGLATNVKLPTEAQKKEWL